MLIHTYVTLRLRRDFSAIEPIRGRCAIPKDKLGPIRRGKPNKERGRWRKGKEGEEANFVVMQCSSTSGMADLIWDMLVIRRLSFKRVYDMSERGDG